jgi:hypothetical protein
MRIANMLASIVLSACLGFSLPAAAQVPAAKLLRKDPVLTRHAEGTFEVKMTPLPADEATGGAAIARYSLDKHFQGDLEAESKGQMLSAGDPSKGNAGYVAIEHVTGALHGHSGSFALQHRGVIDHGQYQLSITVVPGSGTGELAGIAGTMTIVIAAGKHSYTFEYTLPAAP